MRTSEPALTVMSLVTERPTRETKSKSKAKNTPGAQVREREKRQQQYGPYVQVCPSSAGCARVSPLLFLPIVLANPHPPHDATDAASRTALNRFLSDLRLKMQCMLVERRPPSPRETRTPSLPLYLSGYWFLQAWLRKWTQVLYIWSEAPGEKWFADGSPSR